MLLGNIYVHLTPRKTLLMQKRKHINYSYLWMYLCIYVCMQVSKYNCIDFQFPQRFYYVYSQNRQ